MTPGTTDPGARRARLRRAAMGPALTAVAALALLLVDDRAATPLPALILLILAVMFAALYGGLRSGLASVGVGWAYCVYAFGAAGSGQGGAGPDWGDLISAALALPAAAALPGWSRALWKRRAEDALQREQEHVRALQQTLAERAAAQERLEHERGLWAAVLANAAEYIYVKDTEGRYVLASQSLARFFGAVAAEEVIGKTVHDFAPPHIARQVTAEDRQVLETGAAMESETVDRDDAGNERWLLTTKAPWRDARGNVAGLVGVSRDITARRRAMQALREAEAKYRAVVEHLPAIFYIVEFGTENLTTYISPQVETLLGFTAAEWLADQDLWLKQIHPEDRERVLAEVQRVDEAAETLNIDYRLVARDGRVVWVRNQAVQLEAAPDGRRYVHGVMLDITDYKEAERALRDSEERYELVTWATNDAVWDRRLDSGRMWWNQGLQKLFQHPLGDNTFDSDWWKQRIHPDDRGKVDSSLEHALASAESFWAKEYRFQRADGSYADVFDRGYILRDANGKPTRMVGAIMDISDRKRAEEALRAAEARYRALVEQLPAVVYIATWGEEGEWQYVSPQIESLLGFTPGEWRTTPGLWRRQLHPADRERAQENEVKDLERAPGSHSVHEYRLYRRDGRQVWVRDSAVILPGAMGQPPVYHGVLTDITEQKQAESALHEANEILTQWLRHSERRTMELALLNELSSLLQNCHSLHEACHGAAPILRRLFGEEQLGLYLVPAGGAGQAARAVWADEEVAETHFDPEDCWAVRRGQIYIVDQDHPGPACGHLSGTAPPAYLCAPILAQGRPRALLHVRKSPPEAGEEAEARHRISDGQRQLARTVADSMGLAFSNLELRDSLREQSIRDALTGLYNRRYMEESLEREVQRAARHQRTVGLIMLDIDHFKVFNDAYGHQAGDVLLRDLGRILRENFRGADIACRYGGEEFVLILPEASLDATRQRAEQLRGELARLKPTFAGRELEPVTVSMGVAAYPDNGATAETILRAADDALYRAKHAGRDRVMALSGATGQAQT